ADGAPVQLGASAGSYGFTGLSSGDKYTFSVTATNDGAVTGPAGTSNAVVPVSVATSSSDSGTSTSSTGTATASVGTPGQPGSVTASASGAGTVTVGTYSSSPLAGFSTGESWFDVSVAPGSSFSSLGFTICGVPEGDVVQWWNPTLHALQPVSSQGAPSNPGGCITVKVTATTTPSLNDLFGTIFTVPSAGSGGGTGGGSTGGGTTGGGGPGGGTTGAGGTGGGTTGSSGSASSGGVVAPIGSARADAILHLRLTAQSVRVRKPVQFRLTLVVAASVRIKILRYVPASRHGKRRIKAHYATVGGLTARGRPGLNRIKLTKLHGRWLAVGRYRAQVVAGGGAHVITFRVHR
ncbi:MAG: hypothetical protein ACRDLT_06680, partial [Solirubrobacteraceae bacterium]